MLSADGRISVFPSVKTKNLLFSRMGVDKRAWAWYNIRELGMGSVRTKCFDQDTSSGKSARRLCHLLLGEKACKMPKHHGFSNERAMLCLERLLPGEKLSDAVGGMRLMRGAV